MQQSLFGGTFLKLSKNGVPLVDEDDERHKPRTKSPWSAEVQGFNIHAGTTVRAGDREALITLVPVRRAAVLQSRAAVGARGWPGGVSASQAAAERRDPPGDDAGAFLGADFCVGAPTAISVAAQCPACWRRIRPGARPRVPGDARAGAEGTHAPARKARKRKRAKGTSAAADPSKATRDPSKEGAASPPSGAGSEARPLRRLGTGVVPQPFARIDWASLIRRVYLEDVLRCPCGGRRRIDRSVTEPDAVVAILEHLGLPVRAPPVASARDPGWSEAA
jgi:hypothetical protein